MRDREKITEVLPVTSPNSWSVRYEVENVELGPYRRRCFLVQLGGYDESFYIAADLELHIRALTLARPW